MTVLILIISMAIVLCLLDVTEGQLKRVKERKSIAAHAAKDEFDADGHKKVWDAHYTRGLELEQGINVNLTRCENVHCKTCYWKPGALEQVDNDAFPNGSLLLEKRQEFIRSLPDDMSDELCDMMYTDWLEEMADDIEANKEVRRAKAKAKRREAMERKYATPYDDILKYQAEGRTYDKNRGWSRIPIASNNMATPVVALPSFVEERFGKVEADFRKALSSDYNDIADMEVRYERDVNNSLIWRHITTTLKSGQKIVKTEAMTEQAQRLYEWEW